MRALLFFALAAGLFAADQVPTVGTTWKLRSEKALEGNPPASVMRFKPGEVWTIPAVNTNPTRSAPHREPSVVVKFTVSPDGQVLTWEGQGTDAKGKMFRLVQTWDKQ
jgi:hypothetical protein